MCIDYPALAERFLGSIVTERVSPEPRPFDMLSTEQFLLTSYNRDWLVEGIMVRHEPCVLGGPKKTLKSSICIDLAVSLAAGSRFLDWFPVARPVRVGVLNGESGPATLQEALRRICDEKEVSFDRILHNLFWGFELPRLDDVIELAQLNDQIIAQRLEVVIIDPLYLCLLGSGGGQNAANLFDVGPLLAAVTRTCLNAGATPILVHHATKSASHQLRPADLDNLAFAGIQEFARQWILLSRREAYAPGSGLHRLWLTAGGSAGHSGCWALDVNEGQLERDFSGRTWQVVLRTYQDERRARETAANAERTEQERQRNQGDDAAVLQYLRQQSGGDTLTGIRDATGLGRRTGQALQRLQARCQVEAAGIEKPAGNTGTRTYPGYRLVQNSSAEDAQEDSPEQPTGDASGEVDAA